MDNILSFKWSLHNIFSIKSVSHLLVALFCNVDRITCSHAYSACRTKLLSLFPVKSQFSLQLWKPLNVMVVLNNQSQNQLGSSSHKLFTAHPDGESRIQNGKTGVTLLQVSSSLQSLSKSRFAICIKHFFLCTSCIQLPNKRDQLEESSVRWQKYIVLRKIISLLFFQPPFSF